MTDMDHATALRKALAEAYVLDQLDDAERDAFETHFFACPECAEDVRELTTFVDDARIALDRRRRTGSGGGSGRGPTTRARRGRWIWRSIALPETAVAVLSLAAVVYLSTTVVPDLKRQMVDDRAPQVTSTHFLSVARSEPREIRVGARQRTVVLTLSLSGQERFRRYGIAIRDAADAVVVSRRVDGVASGRELSLLLPVANLKEGRYTLELSGISTAMPQSAAAEVTAYPFVLIRQESIDEPASR